MTEYIVEINGNKIERKEITCELIEERGEKLEGGGTMLPASLERVSNLIIKYHWQKNEKPLINALETDPSIYEVELMQKFLLIMAKGEYSKPRSGVMGHKTIEKYTKALNEFLYYRMMGLPIIDKKSGFSCMAFAAKKAGITESTVKLEVLDRVDLKEIFPLANPLTNGHCIRILNGGKPLTSLKRIKELEEIKNNLSNNDRRDIFQYRLDTLFGGESVENVLNEMPTVKSLLDPLLCPQKPSGYNRSRKDIAILKTRMKNKYGVR